MGKGDTSEKAATMSHGVFSRHTVCLVLDYGSQYTQLIARRIRDNGVLSMLLPGDVSLVRHASHIVMHVRFASVGGSMEHDA